jgi:predicted deacylase
MPEIGHVAERVTLGRLPSGVEISTTVHVYEGAADGPTVFLQAAQHGREINGTEVLRRLHNRLTPTQMSGKVIAVPIADPLTFDHVSYTTPESLDSVHPNMNRVWPGDEDGSLHQRMAATLWSYASQADAIIDLHTGSPDMLTHVVYTEGDSRSRELAEAFGVDLLLSEPAGKDASAEWVNRGFDGKLRVAAHREGISAITPELAHNKQLVEDAIDEGVMGVLNVLRRLDIVRGQVMHGTEPTVARNHLGRVDANASGLFRVADGIALGEHVTAGTTVGTIYEPTTYGTLQTATIDEDGILYAITREATVKAGERLASVAIEHE